MQKRKNYLYNKQTLDRAVTAVTAVTAVQYMTPLLLCIRWRRTSTNILLPILSQPVDQTVKDWSTNGTVDSGRTHTKQTDRCSLLLQDRWHNKHARLTCRHRLYDTSQLPKYYSKYHGTLVFEPWFICHNISMVTTWLLWLYHGCFCHGTAVHTSSSSSLGPQSRRRP